VCIFALRQIVFILSCYNFSPHLQIWKSIPYYIYLHWLLCHQFQQFSKMFQQLSLNISFPRAKNIGANSDTHC